MPGVPQVGSQVPRAAQTPEAAESGPVAGAGAGPAVSAAQLRAGQKELTRLERQIARLTEAEDRLATELAASATDYERLIELGAELRTVQQDKAELEERWLRVAEEIGA
jgi:ATP-binding cassette subfamily F protein uup